MTTGALPFIITIYTYYFKLAKIGILKVPWTKERFFPLWKFPRSGPKGLVRDWWTGGSSILGVTIQPPNPGNHWIYLEGLLFYQINFGLVKVRKGYWI